MINYYSRHSGTKSRSKAIKKEVNNIIDGTGNGKPKDNRRYKVQ